MKRKLYLLATICLSIGSILLISSTIADAASVDCVLHNAPGMGCYTYRNEVCIFTIAKTGEKCIFDNQKNENIEEDTITD